MLFCNFTECLHSSECAHREDQCIRLAKLISDVRSERQWKGSMPSVEWFLRRKKGVVSSKTEKMG